MPYNTFQINTTGATPNRIDTTVFGVSLEWIENQTGKSTYQLAYNNYPNKIKQEINWIPKTNIDSGLELTIKWYLQNKTWWNSIRKFKYKGERLGKKK